MEKTLRIGFALGGGNSLGTFNGAALSQALKLLLLRGVDREGRPYRSVEVDVFSGASAGSLSLALMLRGLVQPDPERMMAAKVRLIAEFGTEFTERPKDSKKAIIAAQVLQDLQEEVWVREINLERLLGLTSPDARKRTRLSAGFLDRGAVDDLAREHLSFRGEPSVSKRQILADRVLFASSIANLTPILADATGEFPTDEHGILGLSDGLTSSLHNELRVFDLHFGEVDKDSLTDSDRFPRRWCRYHTGATVRDRNRDGRGIGCLLETRVWSKIAATSIASGAFPLAFEPVPLERRSYEFGDTEEGRTSRWPKALQGKDRHVFTYVDGGVFNNEPIREAFRLASFIDAQEPRDDVERLILFVDPHVVVPDHDLSLDHHSQWLLDDPPSVLDSIQGISLERKTSLDRLVPMARSLFRAINNESRVIEADKVFRTRNRFKIRALVRAELAATLVADPDPETLEGLANRLGDLLLKDQKQLMIPAGSLSLSGEIWRVINEEGGEGGPLHGLDEKTIEEVEAFSVEPGRAAEEERGLWLRALNFVAVDRLMNLEGKLERSELVAISPASDPADPGKLEELPGRMVGGFGGFMSELAGEHEVEVARYCTQLYLQAAGRISAHPLPKRPDFSKQKKRYLRDLRGGLEAVEKRFVELLADSHIDVLGRLPAGVLRHIVRGRLTRFAREKRSKIMVELRIRVPNLSYEFDGGGIADNDLKPRKIKGRYYLITFAEFRAGDARPWSGPHVAAKKQTLRLDRNRKGIRTDQEFCRLSLPTEDMLKDSRDLPHPIWVARIRKSDEGGRLGPKRWKLRSEVEGLDRNLLD